jgi:macrolide-specific efflux system membrane fusion protein
VTNAKGQVASAQGQVADAEDTLDEARQALADAESLSGELAIVAPFDGVVTEVGIEVGDTISGSEGGSSPTGAAGGDSEAAGANSSGGTVGVSVASLETLTVSGAFAEADAADLAVGQQAQVTFPAVPDVEVAGEVTWISPLGASSNSVVTYTATITLADVPETIRLTQTATIEVVTASADDVLYLPAGAVTVLSETTGTVELASSQEAGQTSAPQSEVVEVGIGLQGDTAIEITSGVEEGDSVLVSLDTATGLTQSGQMGFGPMGGGINIRMGPGGMAGGAVPFGGGAGGTGGRQ